MSELYAVVQVCPERRYDYKMDAIRESFSVGLPFIFTDRKRAYREAEKKRKARVPCFVKEFPFNPLDKRLETLEAKVKADAEYIGELERSVKELNDENARLRPCLGDNAENARLILRDNAKLRELVEDMLSCIEIRAAFGRPPTEDMYEEFARQARELGIEAEE